MSLPRKVLEKYVKPGCRFLETGSRWGDTLARAIEAGAASAEGCEIERFMAVIADMHVQELCPKGNAGICGVDSIRFLTSEPTVKGLDTVLFLDAHAENSSPVLVELDAVSMWERLPSAILIDDLRCMKGWGIGLDALHGRLIDMGYKVSYEDGVVTNDIMVGTLA